MNRIDQVRLSFVTCASNLHVLGERLLASPCLQGSGYPLAVYFNAPSAAHGFNAAMAAAQSEHPDAPAPAAWLVWTHQDVVLPPGWDATFMLALGTALQRFPKLAVAGVYGVAGTGADALRAGHVQSFSVGLVIWEFPGWKPSASSNFNLGGGNISRNALASGFRCVNRVLAHCG